MKSKKCSFGLTNEGFNSAGTPFDMLSFDMLRYSGHTLFRERPFEHHL